MKPKNPHAVAMAKLRKGCKERPSEAKAATLAKNREIVALRRSGALEAAEQLRAAYFPGAEVRRQMAAKMRGGNP